MLLPAFASGQAQAPTLATKADWQNLDLQADSVFGVSTERAYKELLTKKVNPVLVAVIDGGFDINHEDLKGHWWNNPKEVAANGKDDDKNGYTDDVYGWDFIGGPKGDVHWDNLELTRLIRALKPRYGKGADTAKFTLAQRDTLTRYLAMVADFRTQLGNAQRSLANIQGFANVLNDITTKMGKAEPTLADFQAYQPATPQESQVTQTLINVLQQDPVFAHFKESQIDQGLAHFKESVDYNLNLSYDPRSIVGDDTTNEREQFYGNNDVTGPDMEHGTHVSGIIGALRDNTLGMKGVADYVTIMAVRTVPVGDERDKDVANAIRYAADNGAKVVNMSFGKGYPWDKKVVDDAVKYAASKDVLLIHAAGNDGKDLDKTQNFPNRIYEDGSGEAPNWIEVGASTWRDDESLVASFSNYGKTRVDLFAPGVRIYSTVPGSKYEELDGTSMATPVVTGVAALVRSRYPKLTAVQVKEILMKSVTKVNHNVNVGGMSVPFSDICVSGGVVNAYNALKLAATYK
jgi:subtilisin family serine protease